MDIRRHLNDEPVLARPPSKFYEFQKTFRRHKVGFVATAAVILVLAAGVALTTWQALRATRAEAEQSRLRQKAEASAEAARQAQLSEAEQRRTADEQRKHAESQELVARQQAYAADMNLVQQSLAIGNLGRARALLNRHKPQAGQPDLRGWEWRYLWGQSRSDAVSGFGPGNQILSSLAISPDGDWLAAGTWGGDSVYVFNLRTKQLVTAGPMRMAGKYLGFSPHSPLLAFPVETEDKSRVRLWDAAKKLVVKDLPLVGRCGRLAFSADGNTLVTTTEPPDSKLTLWSFPAGEVVRSLPIGPVRGGGEQAPLAVAPDVSTVAYVSYERPGVIQVIDIATGQERWASPSGEADVTALAVSPDGKLLASGQGLGGRESRIRLWDLTTGKQIGRPLEGHRAWVSELVFWPDGKKLASASADQTIRLWDVTDPSNASSIRTLQGHRDEVWSLALMPGARYLASGSKDGELLVWDASATRTDKGPIRFPGRLWAWRFAPDNKSVLTLDELGRLRRWTGSAFQVSETLLEFGQVRQRNEELSFDSVPARRPQRVHEILFGHNASLILDQA